MLNRNCFQAVLCAASLQLFTAPAAEAANTQNTPAKETAAIPWDEVGAKAGADYHGEGLSVAVTGAGARLHCVFQRLEGEATGEGLWLVSAVTNQPADRFRVVATAVGRTQEGGRASPRAQTSFPSPNQSGLAGTLALPGAGKVSVAGQSARFTRAGLVEEYSVSMDGVRQDFVVTEKPTGDGPLKVQLAVSGARVERAAHGVQLVLEKSGRKIAYNRLRAADATGKELPARMEVAPGILPDVVGGHPAARVPGTEVPTDLVPDRPESAELEATALRRAGMPAATSLAVVVDDAGAVYPVRIDPTFSDANWISMGQWPGVDSTVSAAAADGAGNLYLGGGFRFAGYVSANYIAEWNGSSWSALGSGMGSPVDALAVSGSTLYAGGNFTTATNSDGTVVTVNSVAQWDGSRWSALGSGIDSYSHFVYALAVSGGTLYAGGNFTSAGGVPARFIARWNGTNWSALGSGVIGQVNALAVSGNTLYAGGNFTTAGGNAAKCIAQWNGSTWSALGSGMNSTVRALAVSGDTLYVGGSFTNAGGVSASGIAQWNGSNWLALGSGLGLPVSGPAVYALAVSGNRLYAGGAFTTAQGVLAGSIAQWNGSRWSPLGAGMDGYVYALAVSGDTLFAGGAFTNAGGVLANCIAQWNGSSWSPLGSGIEPLPPVVSMPGLHPGVHALVVSGNTLYAGGYFRNAGGVLVSCIAQWDGSSWSALGLGMFDPSLSPYVYALAVLGNTLYAGGHFTTAGRTNAYNIAQWNGTGWSPVGSASAYLKEGLNGDVRALAVSGNTLYVGGDFGATADQTTKLNHIAQWDGSSWSALGLGIGDGSSEVLALAVAGNTLYAGGYFATAGGSPASSIAQWDGSSWSALGSGVGGPSFAAYIERYPSVYALAVLDSTLYVGGAFTAAGGKATTYAAEAYLVAPPGGVVDSIVVPSSGTVDVKFYGNPGQQFGVQRATHLSPLHWTNVNSSPLIPAADGSFTFVDTNAPSGAAFYRAFQY